MTKNEIADAQVPPYIPFKAFKGFLGALGQETLPARIDGGVLKNANVNRQYRNSLIRTLRFLGLVDAGDHPTEGFRELITAHRDNEDQYRQILGEALRQAYPFLFTEGFSIETATEEMLKEKFQDSGVTGDTERKCMVFFLHAAKDAGIVVSPHLTIKPRTVRSKSRLPRDRRRRQPRTQGEPGEDPTGAGGPPREPYQDTWHNKLIDKFPMFNPEWSAEAQEKWFEAYQKLLEIHKQEEPNGNDGS